MARLWDTIRAEAGPTYGVFDAARSKHVYPELVRSQLEFRSLYDMPAAARSIDIAPYLVRLDPEHAGTEALLDAAQGESWAIFLTCAAPLEDIRHHLRRFIKVELEGHAHAVFFRFYDPRVFRAVIPRFEPEQLRRWFELPDAYLCEAEPESEGGPCLVERYRFNGEGLDIGPALVRES